MADDARAPQIRQARVKHLFLLLGLNPLPNYVAARILLEPGGKLHLVYSERGVLMGGKMSALERFIERLANDHQIETAQRILVREADRDDIFDKVQQAADLLPSGEAIGLHYTGGTKAMATHAYRALEQWGEKRGRPIVFSYLDARTRTLKIEPFKTRTGQTIDLFPWPDEMARGAPPTLDDLAGLHGERLLPAKQPPALIETARALAALCTNDQIAFALRVWLTKVMAPLQSRSWKDRNDGWKPESELATKSLAWPDEKDGHVFRQMQRPRALLERAFGQKDPHLFSLATARDHAGFDKYSELCAWLNGFWLEHVVLDAIQQIAAQDGIQEARRNLEVQADSEVSKKHPTKFELDVAAMRGYQLFGITCTTSTDKGTGKIKLLEGLVRAQQLGGDEARVALVSLYPNPDVLEHEVGQKLQIGTQVRIFGPAHLHNLSGELHKWFTL